MDCIFCKIANKEIPSEITYENEDVISFKDINPKAPIHFLVVPKKHVASLAEIADSDEPLLGNLILTAKKIAEEKGLKGYKLVINVGREGGQVVDHLHIHLLGGKPSELP